MFIARFVCNLMEHFGFRRDDLDYVVVLVGACLDIFVGCGR